MMVSRRTLLVTGLAATGVPGLWPHGSHAAGTFEISYTPDQWRKRLTRDQYAVLRQSGTERPFTSALLGEHRRGVFTCAGCDLPAFSSETKFESGTGWPSFWDALENGVVLEEDRSYGMIRTAVACRRCGGHLGHVFNDGPKPTGKRYCMNGLALAFRPAAA